MFTQGVDPRGWGSRGQELKEVCLRQSWGELGTKGGGLLCDSLQLTAEPGHVIQGTRGGSVNIHMVWAGKGI